MHQFLSPYSRICNQCTFAMCPTFLVWRWQRHRRGWCLNVSSLGWCICIIISKFLPIFLCSFGTVRVLVVICAHLVSLFHVWCFCPPDTLASKTRLYSYHTDFPKNILYMGCFTTISLSCNFRCGSEIGVLAIYESVHKNMCSQSELVQCTWCLIFEILLGVSICIALHLGQCRTTRYKVASNGNLAISMQLCIFSLEFIYFHQAAISCNGGPCKICTQLVCYMQHLHRQMHNLCTLHYCILLVQSNLQHPSIALCTPLWRCISQLQAAWYMV